MGGVGEIGEVDEMGGFGQVREIVGGVFFGTLLVCRRSHAIVVSNRLATASGVELWFALA
jgi:hypothetical protein